MKKKQRSLLVTIGTIALIAFIAYLLLKNVRDVVTDKVAKRVSKDIAKETVSKASGYLR